MEVRPLTTADEVKHLVENEHDEKKLKSSLRSEVGFQKALHPFDAQERSYLYKMNFLTVEELTENLIILLDVTNNDAGTDIIHFPSEDEIYEQITSRSSESDREESSTAVSDDKEDGFQYQEPLAVVWDHNQGERYWCLGFYVGKIDEDSIKVDHLESKKKEFRKWTRGKSDDIQVVNLIQVLPIKVVGDWNFSERQPVFVIENADEICDAFKKYL